MKMVDGSERKSMVAHLIPNLVPNLSFNLSFKSVRNLNHDNQLTIPRLCPGAVLMSQRL